MPSASANNWHHMGDPNEVTPPPFAAMQEKVLTLNLTPLVTVGMGGCHDTLNFFFFFFFLRDFIFKKTLFEKPQHLKQYI